MKDRITVNSHTCQICGQHTGWDKSFGFAEFVACPKCFKRLSEEMGSVKNAQKTIFTLGLIRQEIK